MLERDPLDVLPFDSFPPPKKTRRTLYPVAGRAHDFPRWFPDGERLLVSRDQPVGDGSSRPDLFAWHVQRGDVRRITSGAGIRSADPSPDGAKAAAIRCAAGVCSLVRVDLSTGEWTTLAAGSPFVVWHRPRWSPDGRRIAASVQRDGRWRVEVVDAATGGVSPVDPADGANRHSPAWTPDGALVVVSERGGVANLELLDPRTATPRTLTRVVGGVAAPDVGPDGRIWYLALHASGYDVRRLDPRETASGGAPPAARDVELRGPAHIEQRSPAHVTELDPRLYPVAARPATPGVSFPERPLPAAHAYGLGPRGWRVLPGVSAGPDGDMLSLMVANIDPVGRLSVVAQGGHGSGAAWRGGSIAAALRRHAVEWEGSAWHTEHAPSRQRDERQTSLGIDSRYTGGAFVGRFDRDLGAWGYDLRVGGSVGRLDGNRLDDAGRAVGFADLRGRRLWTIRGFGISPMLRAQAARGATGGEAWTRTVVSGALSLGPARRTVRLEATLGQVTAGGAGNAGRAFEQFVVGGAPPPFFDANITSQRVSLPAVPVGYAAGRRLHLYKVSIPLLGARPYATWVAVGDSVQRFQRVVGAERSFDFDAIGFARLPATHIRVGFGYSIDEPYDERVRAFLGVTYRP